MADHDRDAGSRGEEEAPRDPTPGDGLGAPRSEGPARAAPPPDATSDATIVDTPHHGTAATAPGRSYAGPPGGGWATAAPPPRSDGFRDFIRQKPAQIIGAGLIGLIIGGLLGGGAVAAISGIVHRRDMPRVYWQNPAWEPYPGYQDCRPVPGGTYCRQQPPYVNPMPRMGPSAVPSTWLTMPPSDSPTSLPTVVPTGRPTPVVSPT